MVGRVAYINKDAFDVCIGRGEVRGVATARGGRLAGDTVPPRKPFAKSSDAWREVRWKRIV